MKRYGVSLSDAAERDLLQIYQWVFEAAGESVADRFFARLEAAALSLQFYPERGVLRESIAPGARMLIAGNYIILYALKGKTVNIMRIVHGRVDLSRLPS